MNSVLLPGGSGGLGRVVTLRLIGEGYHCVVPYRNIEEAQQLRAQLAPQQRDQLLLVEADVVDEAEVERVFGIATAQHRFHALVHLLGGIRGWQEVADTGIEDWDALMGLNLRSLFLFARRAATVFRQQGGGRIVTIGAMASAKPSARQAAYGVSKAGVSALTKILADEGRAYGMTANCILPGIIDTEANRSWGAPEDVPRWTPPAHIAGLVAWLLGEDAASVNGSDIQAFGGLNI